MMNTETITVIQVLKINNKDDCDSLLWQCQQQIFQFPIIVIYTISLCLLNIKLINTQLSLTTNQYLVNLMCDLGVPYLWTLRRYQSVYFMYQKLTNSVTVTVIITGDSIHTCICVQQRCTNNFQTLTNEKCHKMLDSCQ